MLDDKQHPCRWEYGHISGFAMKQEAGLEYPFIHSTGSTDDLVYGTLITWPAGGTPLPLATKNLLETLGAAPCDFSDLLFMLTRALH